MKSKSILFIILIVIFSAGMLVWLQLKPQEVTPVDKGDQSARDLNSPTIPPQKPDPTQDWKTLTNLNHVFRYPKEATGEERDEESVVYFMGQKQIDSGRTQTELFDGYSFRVGEIINESNLSLEQLAQSERENAVNNCDYEDGEVSLLIAVVVDGQNGFQYSATGCYIDYTETIVLNKDKFYRISQSYVGDAVDQGKYEEITNQILSSFEFSE